MGCYTILLYFQQDLEFGSFWVGQWRSKGRDNRNLHANWGFNSFETGALGMLC